MQEVPDLNILQDPDMDEEPTDNNNNNNDDDINDFLVAGDDDDNSNNNNNDGGDPVKIMIPMVIMWIMSVAKMPLLYYLAIVTMPAVAEGDDGEDVVQ